ncbi:MAG: hypothetical protein IAE89_05890 [Anaerolineae bacterium]|nr:hypothetical protein [Anaerolineae bacterium]
MTAHLTISEQIAARLLKPEAREMDRALPEWARRTNPVVKRQLGMYWKLMPVNIPRIIRWYALQAGLIIASIWLPFLFTILMPLAIISLIALPLAFGLFIYVLLQIGMAAANSMVDENRCDSLDLLRVCPRPLNEILYSKGAAAIWRQIENLGLVFAVATFTSLPMMVILFDRWFEGFDQLALSRIAVTLALGSCILRVGLESVMAAAIGLAIGSGMRRRVPANVTTGLLLLAYFAFINLIRLPGWSVEIRLLVEIVIPVALPLMIIPLCIRAAIRQIERA